MMRSEARGDPLATTVTVFFALTLVGGIALLGSLSYRIINSRPRPPAKVAVIVPSTTPSPAPTATTRATLEPTPTQGPSPTATITPSPAPASCQEGLSDGGFETGDAWTIVETAYSAGYVNKPAEYVTNPVRSGDRALRLGIAEGDNVFSYSAIDHPVAIPADVTAVRLSMWLLPVSGDRDEDLQYVLLLKEGGGYDVLMWERSDEPEWQRREFSLDAYRGQEVVVHIGVRNDGERGLTCMYVDDVSLALCYGATPTPYPTEE
jgi:hypothetical protein